MCVPSPSLHNPMENYLWGKTIHDGRWPSMEDDMCWKTTFDGRRPSMEDDLQWNTTFDGRRPLSEGNLQRKTTFNGWWHSMKDKFLKISRFCSAINRRCGNFFDVHYRFWNFSASTFSNSQACAESKMAMYFVLGQELEDHLTKQLLDIILLLLWSP